MVMRARTLLLLAAVAALPVHAQTRTFEVVSIKPNRSGAVASDTNTTPGRLSLTNVTPLSLIFRAFGVLAPQVVGAPDWLSSERYDVVAVTEGPVELNDKDRQPFIRSMLAERWKFRFHTETRNMNLYSLGQSKDGSKMASYNGSGEYAMKLGSADGGRTVLRSTRGNMGRLVEILSGLTNSLVFNDTGLSGAYDFTLEWVQDQNTEATGPSLFTALQEQLGLRLASVRKPVEVIVIDHIERPSEN
jgi:uncharacterized protein (TIGR03435 family)